MPTIPSPPAIIPGGTVTPCGYNPSAQAALGPGWVGHDYESSGPWHITTQSLGFNYDRVAIGEVSSMFVGLSSVSINPTIGQTVMIIQGTAYVDTHKSTEWLNCSGIVTGGAPNTGCLYQQPQRFSLEQIQIVDGIDYGRPASGTFGPRGTLTTIQPYVYRRPWKEGIDQETDLYAEFQTNAFNFSAVMLEDMGQCTYQSDIPAGPIEHLFHGQQAKQNAFSIHTVLGTGNGRRFCKLWAYDIDPTVRNPLPESYAASQDSIQHVQQFTDLVGRYFTTGKFQAQSGHILPAMPHYNAKRHDWTGWPDGSLG